jgi:hypothetical protein
MERQEHAEESIVAASRDSAAGSFGESRLRLATVAVGVVLSEVVDVTVVVVTLLFAGISIVSTLKGALHVQDQSLGQYRGSVNLRAGFDGRRCACGANQSMVSQRLDVS